MRSKRSAIVLATTLAAVVLQGNASWAGAHGTARSGPTSASPPRAGTGLQLFDLSCASVSVCTAVGGNGLGIPAVFRTIDGGGTWSPQGATIALPRITNVSCPTTNFCAAQGDLGAVQNYDYLNFSATKDGGATWSSPTVFVVDGTAGPLRCASPLRCYELGGTGYLERSTDGGTTWKILFADDWTSVDDIACGQPPSCLVVGESARSTLVFGRLVGYGARISHVTSLPDVRGRNHLRISCATPTWCSTVDYHTNHGVFLTTSDGGARWVTRGLPFGRADVHGFACPRPGDCIALVTTTSASGAAASRIFSTTSSGARWSGYPTLEPFLSSLSCASPSTCVALAFDGSVVGTSNGGTTWTMLGTV